MVSSLNVSRPVLDLDARQGQSRLVTLIAATTLTQEAHDCKTILLDLAAGFTVTLPAALGTGAMYRFKIKTTVTGSMVIKVANATDVFVGVARANSDAALNPTNTWIAGATDDTITMNGVATGGVAGDLIKIEDVASGIFHVELSLNQSGTEATPFSATVS